MNEELYDDEVMGDAFRAASRIKRVIEDMPREVTAAILDDIPSSTMLGSAIRQDNSKALMNWLSGMSIDDMGYAGERLAHANQAFEYSGSLKHVPHAESLLRIVDAAAASAEGSGDDLAADTQQFYKILQDASPVIPGTTADNEPMAMESLYFQTPEETGLGEYDVLKMARDELSSDMLDDETRDYWESQVRKLVPELRDAKEIYVDDIPLSAAEAESMDAATLHNEALGKGMGQILTALTGSNRAPAPEHQSVLTGSLDEEAAEDDMASLQDHGADDAEVLT